MAVLSVNEEQVIIHFSASGSVNVTGNNTVSNLTSNSVEIVLDSSIYQIWYGSDQGATVAGSWQIVTGNSTANLVLAVFSGTGHAQFGQMGGVVDLLDSGELLYATLVGTSNGHLMIDLRKNSSF